MSKNNRLPQVLSVTIATKVAGGHSLRKRDTITVPRFNTNYGKNAIAHRGPILWNAIIAQDKDFADTNYKDLAKKIRSIDNTRLFSWQGKFLQSNFFSILWLLQKE